MGDDCHATRVKVITVTHNAEKHIEGLVTCLLTQNYNNLDFEIRDDYSTDRTVELATRLLAGRGLVIANQANKGRCWTLNSALPLYPKYRYLVIINASVRFDEHLISKLVSFAISQGETFGAATPQIYDTLSGRPFVGRKTSGFVNIVKTFLKTPNEIVKEIPNTGNTYFETDSFWGCCCILSANMVDMLKFDEELISFGDEPDMSFRGARLGYKFYWTNSADVWYTVGSSTMDERGPTPYRIYVGTRSKALVTLRYGTTGEIILLPAVLLGTLLINLKRPILVVSTLRAIAYVISNLDSVVEIRRKWRV